jgi:hypothetical protein
MNLPLISETILPIDPKELEGLIIIPPKIDNQIAIVFDNFLRDQLMFNLIKSIFQYCPGVKLYISDQSVFNPVTMDLYNNLIKCGHSITYCGFDCGISIAKNRAISMVTEPFIFTCDSDNLFTEKTNLKSLIPILMSNDKLGYLNLKELRNNVKIEYEINLSLENNTIIYNNAHINDISDELLFCDYTTNEGLFKREIFKDVKFDEEMKLAEHLDFFMQLKYNSQWKVAHTVLAEIDNQDIKIENPDYQAYRNRNNVYWQLYIEKWNINSIVDLKKHRYWLDPAHQKPLPTENITPEKKEVTIMPHQNNPKKNQSLEEKLVDFSLFLIQNNIDFYLLEDTCRRYTFNLPLKLPITIGVSKKSSLKELLKTENIDIFEENELNIIEWIPSHWKMGDKLDGMNYKIPFPVIKYLEKKFNTTIDNLKKEDYA